MTVPPNLSANPAASADFPLAVGPAMITTGGKAILSRSDEIALLHAGSASP